MNNDDIKPKIVDLLKQILFYFNEDQDKEVVYNSNGEPSLGSGILKELLPDLDFHKRDVRYKDRYIGEIKFIDKHTVLPIGDISEEYFLFPNTYITRVIIDADRPWIFPIITCIPFGNFILDKLEPTEDTLLKLEKIIIKYTI